MMQRAYIGICAVIFLVIATAHLSRLIAGWEMVLAGWVVPHWISIPGLIATGGLSLWGFILASRSGTRRTYHM